ncbi:MAG: hypothetical protein HC879_03040 [Leptolyngbyaceae cyanobacterium SL_5_9]|nr:hypothetical protein [Leptolyngbyaceae cyanobacterium SL_5_9]NJO73772.1 hypothetical protein [Leptolyngbyaceae cyanobacterium RM1_406_9]
MDIRQKTLSLIEQLSDDQLAGLLPLLIEARDGQREDLSSETSQAYQEWLSSENDLYDEAFSDELAAQGLCF